MSFKLFHYSLFIFVFWTYHFLFIFTFLFNQLFVKLRLIPCILRTVLFITVYNTIFIIFPISNQCTLCINCLNFYLICLLNILFITFYSQLKLIKTFLDPFLRLYHFSFQLLFNWLKTGLVWNEFPILHAVV